MRWGKLVLLSAALSAAPPGHAHHSGANYDNSRVVTIEGVVTRYEWANPHVYTYVAQTTEAGETVEWAVEGFPPSVMQRIGWARDTLRTGDAVTITGNPAKNAKDRSLFPTMIRRADTVLYEQMNVTRRLMSAGETPARGATGLAGTWETLLPVELMMALVLPDVALTEAGASAVASFDNTMNPRMNCIPHAAPLMMIEPDLKRIVVAEDRILILSASGGAERTVYMNVADHEAASPSIQGHSIGRWDGQTLVIDTARFSEHRMGNGYAGIPSGSRKHLIERLALNENGTRLTYEFELSDPEFLAAPVTGTAEWAYRPDLEFVQEDCDLEVARGFVED